jgi:hypothetical protein
MRAPWAFCLLVPLWLTEAKANEPLLTPPSSVLSVDAGGLLFSDALTLELEHAVLPWASVFVAPGVTVGSLGASAYGTPTQGLWGGALQLGARFYLLGEAPFGLFVGPTLDLAFMHQTLGPGLETEGVRVAGGAVAGLSFRFASVCSLSLGGGALYQWDDLVVGHAASGTTAFVPTARAALGVAF